eukprot:scaffold27981_cov37-Cyclotella_meneghiniana.AAC.10
MAFIDYIKTTPLCLYLISLPRNSKRWQESFDANLWMGGGVGGFLFPVEDNHELPQVESAHSFLDDIDNVMSDDIDLHCNSFATRNDSSLGTGNSSEDNSLEGSSSDDSSESASHASVPNTNVYLRREFHQRDAKEKDLSAYDFRSNSPARIKRRKEISIYKENNTESEDDSDSSESSDKG